MPDWASTLLGSTPDYNAFMKTRNTAADRRTQMDAGQAAAAGDFNGAASAAYRGGDLQGGAALAGAGDQDKQRAILAGARAAVQASQSPEAWAEFQKYHPGIPGWGQHEEFVQKAAGAINPQTYEAQRQAQSNADRSFKQNQSNADRTYNLAAQKVAKGGAGEFGLNPIFSQDENGNVTAYQPNKAGGVKPIEVPTGQRVMGPGDKAAATASGKIQGTAAVNLPTVENAAERLTKGIDSVLGDPGLSGVTGGLQGRLPNILKFGDASRAQSKIDKVQAGTFLQAYNDIRGAGAITEAEGAKASAAYNRLQHQEMDDKDYREALTEFRDEVQRLVVIARQKAGKGTPQAGPNVSAQGNRFDQLFGTTPQGGQPAGGALPGGTYNWSPDGGLSR